MPNVRIYVDESVLAQHRRALMLAMVPLRDATLARLNVALFACQFALTGVSGLPDHPRQSAQIGKSKH